jgi:hypothetical protein
MMKNYDNKRNGLTYEIIDCIRDMRVIARHALSIFKQLNNIKLYTVIYVVFIVSFIQSTVSTQNERCIVLRRIR